MAPEESYLGWLALGITPDLARATLLNYCKRSALPKLFSARHLRNWRLKVFRRL